jgi:hypothetical protein
MLRQIVINETRLAHRVLAAGKRYARPEQAIHPNDESRIRLSCDQGFLDRVELGKTSYSGMISWIRYWAARSGKVNLQPV